MNSGRERINISLLLVREFFNAIARAAASSGVVARRNEKLTAA